MPTYDYGCPTCGKRREVILRLAELDSTAVTCTGCGQPMLRQISAPMVRGDYAGYSCPITGNWIEGRRQHEENLRRHGCRVYEPGETAEYNRRKKVADDVFERKLDETADQILDSWPAEKKEQLAREIASGADATLVRSAPTL